MTIVGVTGAFHVGITVADLERSVRFYQDAIGLTREWRQVIDRDSTRELVGVPFTSLKCEFLTIPGGLSLEILEYVGVHGEACRPAPKDPGAAHLSFWVNGLDQVLEKARELGGASIAAAPVTVPDGPLAGARVVYLRDPDGFILELIEKGPELRKP